MSRPTGQHILVAAPLVHWDRATWSEYLFAIAIIAAPLAIGSVHVLAQIVLAALLLTAFLGAGWGLAQKGHAVRVGWVGVGLLVALAWALLQWLPLPSALVQVLAPASFEARGVAARLAGLEPPSWLPLTLDAGRSAAGIVSLLGILGAYLTATSLRRDSNARARTTIYLELAALGVLLSAVVHHGLGLSAIWGFYEPQSGGLGSFVTSFVNPNHAAALMLLGAVLAFGASLTLRSRRWHLAVGVLLSVGVLASMSRANALLLVLALFVLTVPPLLMPRFRADRARLLRLLVGALCCFFVALVLIGPERWVRELATLDDRGFTGQGVFAWCWSVGQQVLGVQPLAGTGPGNFGVASTAFVEAWDQGYLAYAHNGLQQVLADLGLVVGSLVLLLVGVGFGRTAARGLSSSEDLPLWALVVALGAVALQNLVDFSLWIPGVGIPAAALLGLAVEWSWPRGAATAVGSPRREWFYPAWRWPLWALAIPLGLLVVTAVPAYRERPEGWHAASLASLARLTTKASDRVRPSAGAVSAAAPEETDEADEVDRAALVTEHPHDYLALELAAALAAESGHVDEARRWLEQALVLAPNDRNTLEAAIRQRLLARDEASALALLERLDPKAEGRGPAVELVLDAPWARRLHEGFFARSVPRIIAASQALAARNKNPQADALLVWGLERFPRDLRLYEELARRRWQDAAFLSRLATLCLSEAGAATEQNARWERLGYLSQARVEALEHRDRQAYELFVAAADAVPEEATAPLIEAGKIAQRLGRADWLAATVDRLNHLTIEGGWPLGEYHLLRSQQYEQVGDLAAAIREMHQVLRYLGHVVSMHDRIAVLYQQAGDPEASDRARARARALEAPPGP